jgi:hypothetical protein
LKESGPGFQQDFFAIASPKLVQAQIGGIYHLGHCPIPENFFQPGVAALKLW